MAARLPGLEHRELLRLQEVLAHKKPARSLDRATRVLLGVDPFSILFNDRSFHKTDPFCLGFTEGFLEGFLERMGQVPLEFLVLTGIHSKGKVGSKGTSDPLAHCYSNPQQPILAKKDKNLSVAAQMVPPGDSMEAPTPKWKTWCHLQRQFEGASC